MSKKIEICVVGRRCIYINDYRVAGGKPWVSENLPQWSFHVDPKEILDALPLAAVKDYLTVRSARHD